MSHPKESAPLPSSEKLLTLDDLGLASETVQVLKNRLPIKELPSPKDVQQLVETYSQLLFPTDPVNHAWVLRYCQEDLINLSYLVTSPEGMQFTEAYQYLHRLTGILMAHAPEEYGNIFMMCDGKEYIFQFPNEYHRAFITKLLTTEKNEKNWKVPLFGGELGQEFVTTARDYITELSEVPAALSEAGVATAVRFSHYGVPSWTGIFLEKISPQDIRAKQPESMAARVYLKRKQEVRAILIEAATTLNNPGLILEHIEDYLMKNKWHHYQGLRILEYIYALKNVTGEHFLAYQQLLLDKIATVQTDSKKLPEPVLKALSS